jgi:hypothetical protein
MAILDRRATWFVKKLPNHSAACLTPVTGVLRETAKIHVAWDGRSAVNWIAPGTYS